MGQGAWLDYERLRGKAGTPPPRKLQAPQSRQ